VDRARRTRTAHVPHRRRQHPRAGPNRHPLGLPHRARRARMRRLNRLTEPDAGVTTDCPGRRWPAARGNPATHPVMRILIAAPLADSTSILTPLFGTLTPYGMPAAGFS